LNIEFKSFNIVAVTIAMLTIATISALANPAKPKPSLGNSPAISLPDRIKPMPIEDKQAQNKQILTPLTLTFETPEDYEAFASGKLTTNLILRNESSGQSKTIQSIMQQENFSKPPCRKVKHPKYGMSIAVIIDDLIESLTGAGKVKLTSESLEDGSGVNIILMYSGLGDPAQRTQGLPIKGQIVNGGRNPGNSMVVNLGDNQVITRGSSETLASKAGVLVLQSSKGAGTPKAKGF
jgi:hypothetical protein